MSVEQMCRDLLTQAISDGLVSPSTEYSEDPQCRSSGELVGMANMLASYLSDTRKPEKPRHSKPIEG